MEIVRCSKPVILGEFGAFKIVADDLQASQKDMLNTLKLASNNKIMGVLMWTVDTFEQRVLRHGVECDDDFLKKAANYKVSQ